MGKLQIPRSKASGSTAFQPASRPFAPPRSVPKVQAKLTLGPVGDRYEKEADQVAHQVVQHIASPAAQDPSGTAAGSGVAQRAGAKPDDDLDDVMTKPLPGAVQRVTGDDDLDDVMTKPLSGSVQRAGAKPGDEDLDDVMMKPAAGSVQRDGEGAGGGPIGGDVESSIEGARSGGRALDKEVRASMEPAFGADFSGVRVHADAKADGLNRSLQARAFTTGQDVFFRSGEYNPGSSGGKELIAHELTHVVQQNPGSVMTKPAEEGVSPLDSYLGTRAGERDVPVVGNRFGSPAGSGGAVSEE
jgi:Domain of unknown function (DUF4157)